MVTETVLAILIVDAVRRQNLDEAIALSQLALQFYQTFQVKR